MTIIIRRYEHWYALLYYINVYYTRYSKSRAAHLPRDVHPLKVSVLAVMFMLGYMVVTVPRLSKLPSLPASFTYRRFMNNK